jgi:hypothetical protein
MDTNIEYIWLSQEYGQENSIMTDRMSYGEMLEYLLGESTDVDFRSTPGRGLDDSWVFRAVIVDREGKLRANYFTPIDPDTV